MRMLSSLHRNQMGDVWGVPSAAIVVSQSASYPDVLSKNDG